MKANVKKHVIIGTLSAVCVALVCVIGTQFRSDIPSVENVAEESTEAEIKVEIVTNAKEKNEPAETEISAAGTETATETGEIQHNDFIDNGGIEVDQSFEAVTKPEAPPAPEIEDKEALTDPAEPPQYESEQVEIKPQVTEAPSDTPQHGDKKDGMIYINGFGWIPDEGGGSKSEYAGGMYENGNKIGFFG
ncbi:MAG: hypothetical protein NC203_07415 [Firmicutes bacterium]|nr:hypothetical protein [[Eubacterium] siraeum]MCM1488177.1 hypothetical protein [Bacillota bacterium]